MSENEIELSEPEREFARAVDKIRRQNKQGGEYWLARDLQVLLGYANWEGFKDAIERARMACESSGNDPEHYFRDVPKTMAGREDVALTRYAAYLIAMNGDTRKPQIGFAQTYFAVQARRQELLAQRAADAQRLELREKVAESHKRVSGIAQDRGVTSEKQGIFHDQRFRGLYGGASAKAVKRAKGVADRENFFDRIGPLELSAHDFQMNLAADVISRDNVRGEQNLIYKNLEVAKRVRATMAQAGATMPENLPLPPDPIKAVKKRLGAARKSLPKKK